MPQSYLKSETREGAAAPLRAPFRNGPPESTQPSVPAPRCDGLTGQEVRPQTKRSRGVNHYLRGLMPLCSEGLKYYLDGGSYNMFASATNVGKWRKQPRPFGGCAASVPHPSACPSPSPVPLGLASSPLLPFSSFWVNNSNSNNNNSVIVIANTC